MAARSKVLQRQVQTGVRILHGIDAAGRTAWVSKEMSTSSVIVMEALSRALPSPPMSLKFVWKRKTSGLSG